MQTYTKRGVYVTANETPQPLPSRSSEKAAPICGKMVGQEPCRRLAILSCYDHYGLVVHCCAEHAIKRAHPTAKLTYYGCPVVDEHTDETTTSEGE